MMNILLNENSTSMVNQIYGFSEPANDHMLNIIDMYHNMCATLGLSMYLIGFIMILALDLFNANVNIYPRYFKKWEENTIDIFIVILPLVIILYLAIPAVGYIIQADALMQYAYPSVTVEIVAHQWYWTYYLDCMQNPYVLNYIQSINSGKPITYNEFVLEFNQFIDVDATGPYKYLLVTRRLVLPANEYIRCLITSEDVIHSFALPQLGIKVDAIPGRTQVFLLYADKPGIYYGQCSELCGVNHAFMPISIEFVEQHEFYNWYMKNIIVTPYRLLIKIIENYIKKSLQC